MNANVKMKLKNVSKTGVCSQDRKYWKTFEAAKTPFPEISQFPMHSIPAPLAVPSTPPDANSSLSMPLSPRSM